MRDLRRWSIGFAFVGLTVGAAPLALAQDGGSIGIGPRISFQRVDADVPFASSSPLRLLGGQLKLRLTPKTALELSADYESSLNEGLTERIKTLPFQASVLMYPVRAALSPYLLGGLGWYSHSVTRLSPGPVQAESTRVRQMGYHGGIGAEVRAGSRISVHGDYRYTHIRLGGDKAASAESPMGLLPFVPGLAALTTLQESLKVSHQGSAINWGLTFFF